jgi:hypothetical protein
MNDEAIATILKYMEECLFEPNRNWPESEFDRRSYSRWAATEILRFLMDNPFTPADMAICEFIIKMSYFSHLAKKSNQRFIFAIDTAEDIQSLVT